jgi:hypothetical protein
MTAPRVGRPPLAPETGERFSDGRKVYFSETDFSFGANVPQDSQDLQDYQDSKDYQDFDDLQKYPESIGVVGQAQIGDQPASDNPLTLPFVEYVRKALAFSDQESRDLDADAWHSSLFSFARLLKAHPDVRRMNESEAMQAVERVLSTLIEPPSSCNPWEHFFPDAGNSEAACLDFMVSWNAIRHIPFSEPLRDAVRLAQEKPLRLGSSKTPLYQRFISVAGWLQVQTGDRPIFLPTRNIAELLGCDQRTVSRLRTLAVQEGLLVQVKRHRFLSTGKSTATEFRFRTDRFESLRGEQ